MRFSITKEENKCKKNIKKTMFLDVFNIFHQSALQAQINPLILPQKSKTLSIFQHIVSEKITKKKYSRKDRQYAEQSKRADKVCVYKSTKEKEKNT
ncbi:MAG: hypothetical protein ACLTS6_11120 [Anaerobutyricum sp.]